MSNRSVAVAENRDTLDKLYDLQAHPGVLASCLLLHILLITPIQFNTAFTGSGDSRSAQGAAASFVQQTEKSEQKNDAEAHPYLEEPLEKLVKRIPELKVLQPAPDQHALPAILEKTGERVDEFFRNVVDLAAHEHITEEKLDGQGNVTRHLQVEDSYLILRHGTEIWEEFASTVWMQREIPWTRSA